MTDRKLADNAPRIDLENLPGETPRTTGQRRITTPARRPFWKRRTYWYGIGLALAFVAAGLALSWWITD